MFFIINAILVQVEKYFGSGGAVEGGLSAFFPQKADCEVR